MTKLIDIEFKGNVAIVWADNPPVNAISQAVRSGLKGAFEALRENKNIKAIILACRGRTFFAGADISEFDKPPKDPHLQEVFNVIENMEVPVVAAMFGTSLGGGMEAALASHYRVATPEAKMGLPEVHLGIFPGAGGTQRLPRLVSPKDTFEIILKGKPLPASKAKNLNLLDEIIEGDIVEGALAFARKLIKAHKGPRRVSEKNPISEGLEEALSEYKGFIKTRLRGRENPLLALQAIKAAYEKPFPEGLELEKTLNLKTKGTLESRAFRHVFFAERETRKIPGLSKDVSSIPIKTIGILGAGTMGGGIAMAFANAGFPVTLVENDRDALTCGLDSINGNFEGMVAKGRLTPDQKVNTFNLIQGTTEFEKLKDIDLVIEAVFENMDLKKEIFQNLDKTCKTETILATNTSTLDVNEIAATTKRPDKVLGLHFFSPANIMPLLEVVRGDKTSDQTLVTGLDVGKRIRKIPVVSGVCFGFIGNRMLSPYGREAQRMLLEGATPTQIDCTLEEFGMAMGVLAVYDLAGIDVGHKIREGMGDLKPKDPTYFKAGAVMFLEGRYGQKTGAGFYKYEKGSRQRLEDEDATALIQKAGLTLGVNQKTHSKEEIIGRCFFPMINEAAKILDEGIALRASDIDVVWTSGYGFPRHKGGPMFWADHFGLDKILEGVKKYQKEFGSEFWTPSPLLEALVKKGKSFADWDKENS